MRLDCDFWVDRFFIRSRDSSKFLDIAGPGLLIKPLGVSLFSNFEWYIDKDLYERKRLLVATLARLGVKLTGEVAVGSVWGDEGCDGNRGRVGEEFSYLM